MQPSLKYLGYQTVGLRSTAEKIRAIVDAPTSTDLSQLKSFLGILSYYNKFLLNMATLLAQLYELLRKQSKWSWGTRQEKAFKSAKEVLTSLNLLHHYEELVHSYDIWCQCGSFTQE